MGLRPKETQQNVQSMMVVYHLLVARVKFFFAMPGTVSRPLRFQLTQRGAGVLSFKVLERGSSASEIHVEHIVLASVASQANKLPQRKDSKNHPEPKRSIGSKA